MNAALVQGVGTARAALLNTPQGQALDAKFVSWLVKQQGAGAVLNDVSALVKRYADATRAEADAAQLAKQRDPNQEVATTAALEHEEAEIAEEAPDVS